MTAYRICTTVAPWHFDVIYLLLHLPSEAGVMFGCASACDICCLWLWLRWGLLGLWFCFDFILLGPACLHFLLLALCAGCLGGWCVAGM